MENMKKVVIFIAPPGAGKGTQANLLAGLYGFVHIDTGRYGQNLIYSKESENDPILLRERKNFEDGILFTPSWTLKMISDLTSRIANAGLDVTYSGSPRTIFEAFGDEENKGLITLHNEIFGRENMYIFRINIDEETSIKRNSQRQVCSLCGLPKLAGDHGETCVICGALLTTRGKLDEVETIKVRLSQYRERTRPIEERLINEGYTIHEIDGNPAPYLVFEKIRNVLGLKKI
jgi:adenylate kinase